MQRRMLSLAVMVVAWFSFGSHQCAAQEVVHALTGTVSAVDPVSCTITVKTDDGSEGLFKDVAGTQIKTSFDKEIEAQSTPVDQFKQVGSHVIVYYFGFGDLRTAVAVKELTAASVHKSTGTVTEADHHHHLLTLKDDAGGTQEIAIDKDASVDTAEGVVEGHKYEPSKGEHLTVIWTATNGQNTAIFIYAV